VPTTLAEILFKDYRRRVLGLLLLHPDESYHVREIARLTGTVAGTLHKELTRLADAGILQKEVTGNQVFYRANRDCVIFDELSSILRKTSGLADVLKEALAPVLDQIDFAFVYGSIAKRTETSKSDIDLLVATESLAYADLMSLLVEAERTLGRPVNPTIYEPKQIRKRLEEKNAFVTRVMEQPKIWIKGGDDAIEELGQSRSDKPAQTRAT
jgi:predicted nucleotidyltransferase